MILILEDNVDKVVNIVLDQRALFEHRAFQVCRDVNSALAAFLPGHYEHVFVDFDLGIGCYDGIDFLDVAIKAPKAKDVTFWLTSLSPECRQRMAAKLVGFKYKGWK